MLALLLSMAAFAAVAQQRLTITPLYPERGQTVTVTYDPSAPGAAISPSASAVTMVFTYSNFYNLPWRMPMQRINGKWTASLKLADYTAFATFILESGDVTDKPAKDQHYEIAVYKNKIPVENGYLYKAYSLSAQIGRSPLLADKQAALYEQELALHPDNYEAKVRLLMYKINKATTPAEKEKFRDSAHQVIADQFYKAPTFNGNINKVTMGYLIIGENSRLDSIRKVVMERYPESDMGRELRTSAIASGKDTTRQIDLFETELKKETPENEASFTGMHEKLFQYYAARKDSSKALYHARFLTTEKESPYTAATWQKIAQTLLDNNVALDTARFYAQRALDSVRHYPVGIIRYFPETGYIYPYASDSTRELVYKKASLHLASIQGLIAMKQGRYAEADQQIKKSISRFADKATMDNAEWYYQQRQDTVNLITLKQFRYNILIEELLKQRLNRLAPPLNTFVDMQGKPVDTAALKDKIIVIDFWATWCIPCMEEMPYLQKIYDHYKHNPRIVFMIANSGARNTLANAQAWSGNKTYTFPVYFNTDPEVGDKFKFNTIPASYLIDQAGYIRFNNIGFEGPELEAKLKGQIEILLHSK
ncbi:Thiol-disulfide isomerase or thioredoxin [Chitinophaga costaii]|uniref:Thiol-disulfide isomerase or thioredoxin n=2 Tax=Chitinophaga costaii TaxID=1335309 RepID=A0A1C3ZM24_9BACT|nr:Thiol-disulfide isomerase or thioredoxin [Chitinophaga costaii]